MPRELEKELPSLLWFMQMGLIFFWLHDSSPDQKRSHKAADLAASLILHLVQLHRLPFGSKILRTVNSFVREIQGLSGLH